MCRLYHVSLTVWRDDILLLACGKNGSVEMPVSFQTGPGHGNCQFTPKVVPMMEKQNGSYYRLRDREKMVVRNLLFKSM